MVLPQVSHTRGHTMLLFFQTAGFYLWSAILVDIISCYFSDSWVLSQLRHTRGHTMLLFFQTAGFHLWSAILVDIISCYFSDSWVLPQVSHTRGHTMLLFFQTAWFYLRSAILGDILCCCFSDSWVLPLARHPQWRNQLLFFRQLGFISGQPSSLTESVVVFQTAGFYLWLAILVDIISCLCFRQHGFTSGQPYSETYYVVVFQTAGFYLWPDILSDGISCCFSDSWVLSRASHPHWRNRWLFFRQLGFTSGQTSSVTESVVPVSTLLQGVTCLSSDVQLMDCSGAVWDENTCEERHQVSLSCGK